MAALTAIAALALTLAVPHARAYDASTYAESSKLATGTWVKIQVTQSGIHEITAQDASDWGLGSLDGVHIFGYGGAMLTEAITSSMPDDLPQVPTVRKDGRLLFYAQGPTTWQAGVQGMPYVQQHNTYSTEGYYFVTNDSRFQDVAPTKADNTVSTTAPATTFTERIYHEKDLVNTGQTGRTFLGEDFRSNSRQTFNFDLKGYVPGSEVMVRTVLSAKIMNATGTITLQANGEAMPSDGGDVISACTVSDHDHFRSTTSTKTFEMPGGSTALAWMVNFPGAANSLMARLDYITVNYQRQLALDGAQLQWGTPGTNPAALQVSGCQEGVTHVWDITDVLAPVEMNTRAEGTNLIFSPLRTGRREYVAWNETATFARPTLAERVTNQNLHAEPVPDMIILAPTELLSQARRVATLHETRDTMRVLLVDHRLVFNEFSSGTPDFMAYRKLCKMFYDRGEQGGHKLGYLLLFGTGSYDNRLITSEVRNTAGPLLLTWQSESSQREETSYTSDDILGVLGDDCTAEYYRYALDIAVGRMAAGNVTEARTLVDKLYKYVTQPDYGAWKINAVDMADDGDRAQHMEQAEQLIQQSYINGGASIMHNYVFIDAFTNESQGGGRYYPEARTKLYKTLGEGVLWWTYVGHGGVNGLTADGMVRNEDIENRFYYRHLPLLYAATCTFTRFDARDLSDGELLLLNPSGGIIASICPGRLVYVAWNGEYTRHMGKVMYTLDKDGRALRVGDIWRISKNNLRDELAARRAYSDNHSRFLLLGDPAMRAAMPTHRVVVESYNGQAVNPTSKPTFEARQTITIAGTIKNPDGTPASGFNGKIIATLRDSEQSVTSHGYGDDGLEFTFLDRPNKLAIVADTVKGGTFSIKVAIPMEIYDNYSPAMINLYAYDSTHGIEAMGSDNNFYIYGYDEQVKADTDGPEIQYFGLNGASFEDGDNVNESPLVIAQVSDESGLNFSSSGVGHAMTLTLDGVTTYNDVTTYYTPLIAAKGNAGAISYPLTDLPYGPHTLRLRVWDVYNNPSEKTINFNVMQGLKPNIVDVKAIGNPASVETRFIVTHDRPDAVMTVTIEVFDMMGRRVWSTTQTGRSDMFTATPVVWNLTDYSGNRVARGIYIYRATITADGVREDSKAKRIAVTGH